MSNIARTITILIHEILRGFSKDVVSYHELKTGKTGAERHIDMQVVVPKKQTVVAKLPMTLILIACKEKNHDCWSTSRYTSRVTSRITVVRRLSSLPFTMTPRRKGLL